MEPPRAHKERKPKAEKEVAVVEDKEEWTLWERLEQKACEQHKRVLRAALEEMDKEVMVVKPRGRGKVKKSWKARGKTVARDEMESSCSSSSPSSSSSSSSSSSGSRSRSRSQEASQ